MDCFHGSRVVDSERRKYYLKRLKSKATQRNDFAEAAKICNCIGEMLSQNDLFEDAVSEHKEEIHFSEAVRDTIGVAVGNRKVGECLCSLGEFEEALSYQKKHLEISQAMNDLLEQQRALATIGRTFFLQAESLSEERAIEKSLNQSQEAYLSSLDIANNLHDIASDKEVLEMKARLYLNLGLVHEWKHNTLDALKYLQRALVISRYGCWIAPLSVWVLTGKHNLERSADVKNDGNTARDNTACDSDQERKESQEKAGEERFISQCGGAKWETELPKEQKLWDNIFRCHFTLSGLYFTSGSYMKALQSSKTAVDIAQERKHEGDELDALSQMGLVLLHLCEFESAKQSLKKVYKSSNDRNVVKNLKVAIKAMQLTERYKECKNKVELMQICEKLGDLYSDIKSPEKALQFYLQQLSMAESLDLNAEQLVDIYASIAVTYTDCKQYQKALKFYQMELSLRKGQYKEKSETYCAIAKIQEDVKSPFETIKKCYTKALSCAQTSGSKLAEIKVYEDLSETLKSFGLFGEYEVVLRKKKSLQADCNEKCESEDLEDIVSQLNEDELLSIQSDEELDEEEATFSTKQKISEKKTLRKQVDKINERGETPLHVAAITGNLQKVKALLQQGAYVHSRDYCGWQPLHEACNHGFTDIACVLIQYGANVSDPGGKHCGGITPLHDASQNGHLDIVKLLVEKGASSVAKTSEGFSPLDLVKMAIKADEEEFLNQADKAILNRRKEVAEFLSTFKVTAKFQEIPAHLLKDRNKTLFGLTSSESESEECFSDVSGKRHRYDTSPTMCRVSDSLELSSQGSSCSETDTNNSGSSPQRILSARSSKTFNIKVKRRRQSQISFSVSQFPTTLQKVTEYCADTKNKKRKRVFNDDTRKFQRSSERKRKQISLTEGNFVEKEVPPTQNMPFRIKMRISDQLFLISCPNTTEMTINWLLNEAKQRYKSTCNVSTKLCLKTTDNALLDPNDVIGDVIMNNEEVVADIIGLDFPPVLERYKKECDNLSITPFDEINCQMIDEKLFHSLDLNGLHLSTNDIQAVVNSLSCNTALTMIDSSTTFLGDDRCIILINCLRSLPNISTLNLSCVGMTTKSLVVFAKVLKEITREEHKLIMKNGVLSSLSVLLLDHNDFTDEASFAFSLSEILTHCMNLDVLCLQFCKIQGTVFKNFPRLGKALKASNVTSLNMSHNHLGIRTNDLLKSLNLEVISCLDLSAVMSWRATSNQDVSDSLLKSAASLRELSLNHLSDKTEIGDWWEVRSLYLQHQSTSNAVLLKLMSNMSRLKHLTALDVSYCENLGSGMLDSLLYNLMFNKVMLRRLSVCACSICSPLPPRVFSTLSQKICPLEYFNVSNNDITEEEKYRLFCSWKLLHGDMHATSTLYDTMCLFQLD